MVVLVVVVVVVMVMVVLATVLVMVIVGGFSYHCFLILFCCLPCTPLALYLPYPTPLTHPCHLCHGLLCSSQSSSMSLRLSSSATSVCLSPPPSPFISSAYSPSCTCSRPPSCCAGVLGVLKWQGPQF